MTPVSSFRIHKIENWTCQRFFVDRPMVSSHFLLELLHLQTWAGLWPLFYPTVKHWSKKLWGKKPNWNRARQKRKKKQDVACDSPAVLHVGRFVHADSQFDFQLCVLAVLGDNHTMELCVLWSIGSRVQDYLRGRNGEIDQEKKTNKQKKKYNVYGKIALSFLT